ncbi:MAG: dienelactone hydrolase family protein [Pseudomonadota bacterium]
MILEFEAVLPAGAPSHLFVFVHGYGADGHDLIGLAQSFRQLYPDALYLSPHAPDPCVLNPMGRQWFPVYWIDGSDPADMGRDFAKNTRVFDAWLTEQIATAGVPSEKVILVGFSQGCMVSLEVGPRRTDQLGAILGFSGRLIDPDRLPEDKRSDPPILLVHGNADDVVPYDSLAHAEAGLLNAGLSVETHTSPGMGHGIAPDGLQAAATFLQRHLR